MSVVLFLLILVVLVMSVSGKSARKDSSDIEKQQATNMNQQVESTALVKISNPLTKFEKIVCGVLLVVFLYWVFATLLVINVFDYGARYRDWSFSPHCYWHSCNYGNMFSTYFFVLIEGMVFSFIGLISLFSVKGSQMRRISIGLSVILAVVSMFVMYSLNHLIIYNLNFSLVVIGGYWLLYWMFEQSILKLHTVRKTFLSRLKIDRFESLFMCSTKLKS